MTQKLFALANEKCAAETPDNPMNQEILLGGHVYLLVLKVKRCIMGAVKLHYGCCAMLNIIRHF